MSTYSDLIHEAFIAPIRTATIIDDEYPTLDGFLEGDVWARKEDASNEEASADEKSEIRKRPDSRWADPDDVARKIAELRKKASIVDIHDGNEADEDIRQYCHSDLVILDFQLDGPHGGEEKAVEIARKLLTENKKFNLIVLHTQCKLMDAFDAILRSVLPSGEEVGISDEDFENISEFVDDELDLNAEEVFTFREYTIYRKMGTKDFIAYFMSKKEDCDLLKPLSKVISCKFNENSKISANKKKLFILYLIKNYEKREKFQSPECSLDWSISDALWIKSDRGFLVFMGKNEDQDIYKKLQDGIVDWRPNPSRLISAKIRNIFQEQGSFIGEKFLCDRHAGALAYHSIVKEVDEPKAFGFEVSNEISRHLEFYQDQCDDLVQEFVEKIVASERSSGVDFCCDKFRVDLSKGDEKDIGLSSYNCYISTKKAKGNYLRPGQILFDFVGDAEDCQEKDFWVVATPACDLVPGQKDVGAFKPFTVIKLFPIKMKNIIKKAHHGNYIFLMDENKIHTFSIFPTESEGNGERAPKNEVWYARKQGRFRSGNLLDVVIPTFSGEKEDLTNLTVTLHEFQLRYEYALNILSKVGMNASRVGLSFKSDI